MADTETGATAAQPDPTKILIEGLWDDPRTRPMIAAAIETKHPGSVPGFHVSRLQTELQSERDRAKAINDKAEQDQRERDLTKARRGVLEAGLTEADVPEVEKLMQDELIGTHKTAAEILRRRRQEVVAGATRGRPGAWERPGQDKANKWFEGVSGGPSIAQDRRTWAKDRAHDILADFERQRSAGVM